MENQTNIYKKLFELQSHIGKIAKDSENPFFKSKYFDINKLIEALEPHLISNGLLLLQPILNGKVRTEIIDVETGEKEISEIQLPEIPDPQKLGSAITYYRRYTLQSLLGLQAEDDDGNKASGNQKPSKPKQNNDDGKVWLNKMSGKDFTKEWLNILQGIGKGTVKSVSDVRKYYKVSKEIEKELDEVFGSQKPNRNNSEVEKYNAKNENPFS